MREPLLRELFLWRAPSAFSSTTQAVAEGESATISFSDAGVEETKGEGIMAETKDDTGKGDRGRGGGRGTDGAPAKVGLVFDKKGGSIAARFEVLQQLNRKLRDALPYFDLTQVWFTFHVLMCVLRREGAVRTRVLGHLVIVVLLRLVANEQPLRLDP